MDGMQRIKAVASLVESAIVWRAQYIAWNVDIFKAEQLLFRLVFKEGSQNPQAMDMLARIYFQQSKYEKAKDLWNRASELQPGNPALKRTAAAMRGIAKSPSAALLRHKARVLFGAAVMLASFFLVCWGGVLGYRALGRWAEGPVAVQNLAGMFHYEYDSVTKGMVYVPGPAAVESAGIAPVSVEDDGIYSMGFTRKKASSGRDLGRIEVVVERVGSTLKVSGRIPDLHVRYLVEQSLWEVPGITELDMRGLEVDRTYRVNRGDSLWIIAKKIYGNGSAWTLLAKINNLENPNVLRVGQDLALPLGDEILVQDAE
ncbi:MAG: LysM peptidoglycan-binding domain-containing protein [Synergistaceae bacterium]|jgi:nucleoid-associated protein YgaU|nr:LysM peptidoglycan-binding domain-containing protein [Synergistaceae bacterium]